MNFLFLWGYYNSIDVKHFLISKFATKLLLEDKIAKIFFVICHLSPHIDKAAICSHLQLLLFLFAHLFPLVDNSSPQDPRVLFQVGEVGGGRGTGH